MQQEGSKPQALGTISQWSALGPVASQVLVLGLDLALPLAVMVVGLVQWGRYRWRASVWRATLREDEPLGEGDTVLRGRVEHATGSARAVRVAITQEGTEKISKNLKGDIGFKRPFVFSKVCYIVSLGEI